MKTRRKVIEFSFPTAESDFMSKKQAVKESRYLADSVVVVARNEPSSNLKKKAKLLSTWRSTMPRP